MSDSLFFHYKHRMKIIYLLVLLFLLPPISCSCLFLFFQNIIRAVTKTIIATIITRLLSAVQVVTRRNTVAVHNENNNRLMTNIT